MSEDILTQEEILFVKMSLQKQKTFVTQILPIDYKAKYLTIKWFHPHNKQTYVCGERFKGDLIHRYLLAILRAIEIIKGQFTGQWKSVYVYVPFKLAIDAILQRLHPYTYEDMTLDLAIQIKQMVDEGWVDIRYIPQSYIGL